ncbi:response regulator [Candidatus Sumerlaeota bacterium]|nr:response regulator [Candidatus Sumerlaeota bacterium]
MARIFVVDDDAGIIDACRLFLEREGHQVESAQTRAEGMKALGESAPDLLILDVMLEQPDDGIAMARDLRDGGFDAPILMLTSVGKATGMQFDRDETILPVDAFEEKPISPSRLIEVVNKLLAGKE